MTCTFFRNTNEEREPSANASGPEMLLRRRRGVRAPNYCVHQMRVCYTHRLKGLANTKVMTKEKLVKGTWLPHLVHGGSRFVDVGCFRRSVCFPLDYFLQRENVPVPAERTILSASECKSIMFASCSAVTGLVLNATPASWMKNLNCNLVVSFVTLSGFTTINERLVSLNKESSIIQVIFLSLDESGSGFRSGESGSFPQESL